MKKYRIEHLPSANPEEALNEFSNRDGWKFVQIFVAEGFIYAVFEVPEVWEKLP